MPEADLRASIARIEDRHAIEDLLQRYCRTQDWLDDAGQASCFWPDAEIDYGFFEGSGADFVTTVMEVERSSDRRWHMTGAPMIQLDGDRASAESYGIAAGFREGGEFNMFGGRYLDELQKRDGEWRISRRKYVLDWGQSFPNTLDAMTANFPLHVLNIRESGHPDYRPM